MMNQRMRGCLLHGCFRLAPILLWLLASALPARAAVPPEDHAAAEALASSAATLAKQGRFEDAAALYEKAYALDPQPVLLFNLGFVHERRGAEAEAIQVWRRYLEVEPDPAHRQDATARLEAAQARLAARGADAGGAAGGSAAATETRAEPASDPVRPPVMAENAGTLRWWLIGGGTALVVAGGIVAALLLAPDPTGPPTADATWLLSGSEGR